MVELLNLHCCVYVSFRMSQPGIVGALLVDDNGLSVSGVLHKT